MKFTQTQELGKIDGIFNVKYRQGWYKLKNLEKFLKPMDEHMGSFKDGHVQYKSSLEYKAFKYADNSKDIKQWSVEPFAIQYLKPTDGKMHRYYIDLFLVTNKGTFLIEIKPKSQTVKPKPPKIKNKRSVTRFYKELETYSINLAKWQSAKKFAESKNMQFLIFTENEL